MTAAGVEAYPVGMQTTRIGRYTVKPSKVGRDGDVIYWGVYRPDGKLAAQVVRSRGEAVTIAERARAMDHARRRAFVEARRRRKAAR